MAKVNEQTEGRLTAIEQWITNQPEGNNVELVNNYSFLIGQLKALGDRLGQVENSHRQLEGVLQQNNVALTGFLEEKDLVIDWQTYVNSLEAEAVEEAEDATEEGKETEDDK
jgi:hypothetical protein|tara:strand:- start:534 stop:869 length:336 start_codon:yes stop_codon:yes gene_type:complete